MTADPRALLLSGLAALAAAWPAAAFDCVKASLPAERTICAAPAVKASDDAMEAAFEAVRNESGGEERRSAVADQRIWLKARNDDCMAETRPAACFRERNAARTRLLAARPESGPGPDGHLRPVFVRQAGSRTKVALELRLYRFAEPHDAGERTLNAEADKTIADVPRTKDEPDDHDWSRDETWTIAYASPSFVSIQRTSYAYSGGAHGIVSTSGLNIDMRSGRILTASDLFDETGAARLSTLCATQIRAEKKQRGAEADASGEFLENVAGGVGNLVNWSFAERGATVYFGPYALGSYAEGAYACTLPIAQVNAVSKRPLPLR